MKCPECVAAGLTSEVRALGPRKPIRVPGAKPEKFWDEDGEFHDHHRAVSGWKQRYKCNQKPPHHFTVESESTECWCGYPTSGPYATRPK